MTDPTKTDFIATGVIQGTGGYPPFVVLCTANFRVMMSECDARKVADDLVRNADCIRLIRENQDRLQKLGGQA